MWLILSRNPHVSRYLHRSVLMNSSEEDQRESRHEGVGAEGYEVEAVLVWVGI